MNQYGMQKREPQRVCATAMFIMEGIMGRSGQYEKFCHTCGFLGEGVAETIYDVADYALVIDDMAMEALERGGEYNGVFDYEVSSEFGSWLWDYYTTNRAMPLKGEACAHIYGLIQQFFFQGVPATHDSGISKEKQP